MIGTEFMKYISFVSLASLVLSVSAFAGVSQTYVLDESKVALADLSMVKGMCTQQSRPGE